MEQGSDPWGQNGQAQYKLHRCLLHLFKKAGRISNLELSGKVRVKMLIWKLSAFQHLYVSGIKS
jgi:hypothetical protein